MQHLVAVSSAPTMCDIVQQHESNRGEHNHVLQWHFPGVEPPRERAAQNVVQWQEASTARTAVWS